MKTICNLIKKLFKPKKMTTEPEILMTHGFEHLRLTRQFFDQAKKLYDQRNDETKADKENSVNVQAAIQLLAKAYDEVSAIWENDINI